MATEPKPNGPKIGEGHASAMFRQGLRELRGALYPESNVAQPPEYGLYGTQTPGEVAEARRATPEPSRDEEPIKSPLADSLRRAESRPAEPNRDSMELDR
jgi:hypothetical protein